KADVPERLPTVYVLAIGINEYANPQFNLAYARADAQAFATELALRQRAMKQVGAVRVVTLLDGEASRANILLAIQRLSGTATETLPPGAPLSLHDLAPALPEDTVILYFAGHGLASGDRFHLIPADIAYHGARAGVSDALTQVLERSVSDLDLERALEP